ncbi:MAG: DUF1364 family protein [Alphaproteobacteria bacterium]|nr:DUF1364 family protein [Alphaproteobacteria bacterium]
MTSTLTESARGEECTLMIAPYCNNNPETVVLCHLPSQGSGMALKSPDHWAAYGCSACHDILDQRNPQAIRAIGREEIMRCMFRGLYRTQQRLIEKGLMRVAK